MNIVVLEEILKIEHGIKEISHAFPGEKLRYVIISIDTNPEPDLLLDRTSEIMRHIPYPHSVPQSQ